MTELILKQSTMSRLEMMVNELTKYCLAHNVSLTQLSNGAHVVYDCDGNCSGTCAGTCSDHCGDTCSGGCSGSLEICSLLL